MLLLAIAMGIVGTWYFGHQLKDGISQLIGIAISGTTLALFTAFRSETIRWQDNHMRRIDNSDKVIDYYNNSVRERVIAFMVAFDEVEAAHPELNNQSEFELNTARRLGLPKILHLIDKIAWLLEQNSYLEKADVLSAIASELSRLLVAEKYQWVIEQTLVDSSLEHVKYLIVNLKEVKNNDRQR